ncbi:sensor histidine kinase [Sphingomonas sp. M1-B02]|uniref:sensor histidine kinase n=1 Tax=Sphingomonas sp. M1-B02 TaxID=3114300 RepID=UPI00223FBFA7|nr:HAMP domain-containing sensor histidine kinase [Sphingomonas sp. S6-11]UZK67486.1 HAMP domain-containing histidine kinase [Sphingomonas sp. S6-11]
MRRRTSLVARAALAVAGLALVAIALLYAVTVWVVRHESDAALQRAVDVEIAALADIHASGGRRELVARIRDRLAMRNQDPDQTHYLLADTSGTRIAGDIARWPLLSAENSQAGFVTLDGGTPVFARATQLDPQLRLVAAREYGGRSDLLRHIGLAFLLAGLAVVAAALGLTVLAAARLRARVEGMNAAFDAVEQGDLQERIPGADHSDELGQLALHANLLLDRLGAVIHAQRDVTDQVAHEIRTPLVHLDTRLLRLIDRAVDPALVAALGAIRQEGRRIGELLDSLLDIAASEARRGDRTGFVPVDLSEIARCLADLYADSAVDLGLDFHTEIAADVTLAGDAMQLTRAISNLLDNAFKYSGAGARILLAVQPGPRIIVRDNGPGVPEALRARIFERFQRGEADQDGHGLGLALVRAIARRHGLEVTCRDAHPGAEFTIAQEKVQ